MIGLAYQHEATKHDYPLPLFRFIRWTQAAGFLPF